MRQRVLLVDRNDDFLDGLCSLLEKEPGLEIVGRAHSAQQAIARASKLAPDIVLMDVSLPDVSGFRVVPRLKALRPTPLVLLMTFHDSRAAVQAALEAGADRCLSKIDIFDRLLLTLHELVDPALLSGIS